MNRIFNKKLYLNTVGRLKLSGSIFLILCIVLSYVPIISSFADASFIPGSVSPYFMAFPLYFFMFVGSMVLTMSAFSYLNNRAASDLYHSLPNTRLCTLISLLGGVLTWVVGTILATCMLSALGYTVLGCSVNMGELWAAIGYPLMVSLEIIGCTLIGMSVTGTFFSGIITTGLVAFLPRALILFFQLMILNAAHILPSRNFMGGFFDIANNLDVAFFSPMFYGGYNTSFMENPAAYLYTAVLIIVYFAVGGFLFVRRKSEIAGKAAPGKVTQAAYRCALTLPVLLVFYFVLLSGSGWSMVGSSAIVLILILIGAAIVYFVYEAIVSRKIRSLVRAVPIFILLVAATGVMAFSARNIGIGIMKYVPAEENVASVQILQEGYNYNEYLGSQVQIEDPNVIASSVICLEDTVKYWESDLDWNSYYKNSCTSGVLRYNMKDGTSIERVVNILQPEAAKISSVLAKNEDYLSAVNAVPDQGDIIGYSVSDSRNVYDESVGEAVYAALLEDLKKDPDAAHPLSSNQGRYFPNLEISVKVNGASFCQTYNITTKTPLALAKYMEYEERVSSLKDEIDAAQKAVKEKVDLSISVTIASDTQGPSIAFKDTTADYSSYNDVYLQGDRSEEDSENAGKIIEMIKKVIGREVSEKYQAAYVGIYVYGGRSGGDFEPVNCSGTVLLTKAELEQIKDLTRKLSEEE